MEASFAALPRPQHRCVSPSDRLAPPTAPTARSLCRWGRRVGREGASGSDAHGGGRLHGDG
eukprot:6286146-Lingulodinium_polyedra.AAC.1